MKSKTNSEFIEAFIVYKEYKIKYNNIIIILMSKLEHIKDKYKDILENYRYISNDEIDNITSKCYICYVKKNNLILKKGFVKDVKDKSIIELINNYKKYTWYIYSKDYYIFLKESSNTILKNALQSLIKSDFSDIRNKIKIKKLNQSGTVLTSGYEYIES